MGEKKEEWREREGGREQGEREIEKETYIHINGMLAAWVCYPEKTLTKPKKLRFWIHFDYKIEAIKENGYSKPPAKVLQYLDKDWEWCLGFIKCFQCLKNNHMSQWREDNSITYS